jgi:ribosomal protein S18 acetylase RimI-like enzyme
MYQKVKEWAEQDEEVSGIRLYVDKTNQRAIEVYKRVGMNGEHYQLFEWMID